jgi:hypothetical protein
VPERGHDSQGGADERRPPAVPELVEEQVESARAGVFRAYVRAREQARRLAEQEPGRADDRARASD